MIGETFGNYRLVRRLGSGTMGTVYLGEHERIVRRAAIKILASELAVAGDILDRFFEEARATSLIQHPAIVEVLDCGVHPDGRRPYIAMQLLEGDTLAATLAASGALGWRQACGVARQMAEGLAAAHRHGIVHRDVKPANVMLLGPEPEGGAAPRPLKLLDFGVAKLLHEAQSKFRTCPGSLLGTPEYMAPEQCGGEGQIDGRTDIYALGCVLFEMVCGRLPFQADLTTDLLVAHRWREAPAASAFADLPRGLDRLIAKMLAKRPEDRPPDMPAVARVLSDIAASPAATPSDAAPAGVGSRARGPAFERSRAIVAWVALTALLGIGAQAGHGGAGKRNGRRGEAARAVWAAAPAGLPARLPAPAALTPAPKGAPPMVAPPPPRGARAAPAVRRARSARATGIDAEGIVHL